MDPNLETPAFPADPKDPEPSWIEILQNAFDGVSAPDQTIEEVFDHFERMP
ncbi:hypothetical protein [Litoreibacter roseus]|uniref:Uncharacterized protein n=1 Tax=Litoreibacter roseus TaxID=2601869 RepID=A0A6N6JLS4_9RHOB|nr:hypothetical protein [Litoreibacter roseus]GFE66228.1 hypothetical protein KIN_33020 [Litoreibacter roseus]